MGYLLVRGAASLKLGKICFAILIERSQAGANEVIRPDEIGLACHAEPFLLPAAATGDDLIDLLV